MTSAAHENQDRSGAGIGDKAWTDVLQAVDRTYAELVEYQEQLELRNAELTNLRRFLASIMTSISDYLVVTDRDGRVAEVSGSFSQALDREPEAFIGEPIGSFFAEDERALVLEAIERSLSLRQDQRVNVRLTTPDGLEPVEIRISPRLDRRKKPAGAVLTARPMGELLRAYADLETSHQELKEAQAQLVRNEKMASLGRLLAGVAHELNNPISFVYANTHTLDKYMNRFETYFEKVQAGSSREELIALRQELQLERSLHNLRNAVQGASDGAARVRDIVEDLRRLSAEGSGETGVFDLAELARLSANWIERGTKTQTRITFDGLPSCEVRGKPGHIQQVLMNLVQNAVDAMEGLPDPEIRFTLARDGDNAIIDVRDFGPGIPLENTQSIFDPFYTTKEVGKGTGLGLSISHKIIQEHGGTLELVEHDGQGACFRVILPMGGTT